VIITENFSPLVSKEIDFSEATKKPFLFFVKQPMFLALDFYGYKYFEYKNSAELFRSLVTSLRQLKSELKRTDYIEQKKEEKTISDVLNSSLEKNVLVLGKDSD